MKFLRKTLLIIFVALLGVNLSFAQEILTGLRHNPVLMNKQKNNTKSTTPVYLPFFDDFSNYTGYPKSSLWNDNQAFVNNSFPVYPPSIGVATLDALDENGQIYAHAETRPFGADTLTSRPINLEYDEFGYPYYPSDSIYFSFYYQPGGASKKYPPVEWERIGDKPESGDSLVLEFGYPTGGFVFVGYDYCDYELTRTYNVGDSLLNPYLLPDTVYFVFDFYAVAGESIMLPCDSLWAPEYHWDHIWATPGCKVDDWLAEDAEHHLTYFKKVMIPITNLDYFRDDFQFRFRNYASLEPNGYDGWASNADQWHIDYVMLEENMTCHDLYPDDVTFVSPTTSALKNYQSMPWNQFRSSDMKDKFDNELANISSQAKNVTYNYRVTTEEGALVAETEPTSENAYPYYNNGLYVNPVHTQPSIAFVFPSDGEDSAIFKITHVFNVTGWGDDCEENDTCVFYQKFYNYYAYDDGTAEAGYSLISTLTNPETYLAMRFNMAQSDTLRGVRMWFNSVLNDANTEPFTLMVWNDMGGVPGDVIAYLSEQYPDHAANPLDFVSYYLDEPIVVPTTFYVGIYQNHNVPLNIGFDQNNDARAHWLYSTSGEWREPFLLGAPMIRPVLGKDFDKTSVPQVAAFDFQVYPNPATDQITILQDPYEMVAAEAVIFDVTGRKVAEFALDNYQNTVNISHLTSGMYLLQLKSEHQTVVKKIIKR